MIRQTHTYVTLEISKSAYDEIRAKLEAAGYQHTFMPGVEIDMHGIALVPSPEIQPALVSSAGCLDTRAMCPGCCKPISEHWRGRPCL